MECNLVGAADERVSHCLNDEVRHVRLVEERAESGIVLQARLHHDEPATAGQWVRLAHRFREIVERRAVVGDRSRTPARAPCAGSANDSRGTRSCWRRGRRGFVCPARKLTQPSQNRICFGVLSQLRSTTLSGWKDQARPGVGGDHGVVRHPVPAGRAGAHAQRRRSRSQRPDPSRRCAPPSAGGVLRPRHSPASTGDRYPARSTGPSARSDSDPTPTWRRPLGAACGSRPRRGTNRPK